MTARTFAVTVVTIGGSRSTTMESAADGFAAVDRMLGQWGPGVRAVAAIHVRETHEPLPLDDALRREPINSLPVVTVEGYRGRG